MPCHLLVPGGAAGPLPVVLCLQGHTTGMHLSLGRPGDDRDRHYALQAVAHGYAALAIELRGFGERRDCRPATRREARYAPDSIDPNVTCKHSAMTALLLGRTSLGEKILDITCALDALAEFPEVDGSHIIAVGNSGGGALGWYAACVEPRIQGLILGSCFATYAGSIGSIDHCCDNYLPGVLRWFDFADLAVLVAPRPLVVAMGTEDPLFPVPAIDAAWRRCAEIYAAAGAADRCRLVMGEGGHRFYAARAWAAFEDLVGRRPH
jgi:dienelactone hydrolase